MSEPTRPTPDGAPPGVEDEPPAAPEPAPTGPPPTAYLADLVLVGVCAWFLWNDYQASRSGDVALQVRTWTFMLNLTCAFVVVHRTMAFVQRNLGGPRAARLLGGLKWGMALVVPIAVAGHLEREAQMAHKAKLDAYVARVDARIGEIGARGGRVDADALASLTSPYLTSLTVRTDTGAYLVTISLPAVDIDGYTGRYSSTEGRWHIHHNDLDADSAPVFDASGPILTCSPAGGRLACR